jgi:hypothetical protein
MKNQEEEDPFLHKGRQTIYDGVPVLVYNVGVQDGTEKGARQARLSCLNYTNGRRDLSRGVYRRLGEEKVDFDPCGARWQLQKKEGGSWELIDQVAHSCVQYRPQPEGTELSPAAPEPVPQVDSTEPAVGDMDFPAATGEAEVRVLASADAGDEVDSGSGSLKRPRDTVEEVPYVRRLRPRAAAAPAVVDFQPTDLGSGDVERPGDTVDGACVGDTRPPIEILAMPQAQRDRFRDVVLPALKDFSKWTPLTGGSKQRWYIPDLIKSGADLEALLARETEWARKFIQERYPALELYKLGALKSDPGAPSQFAGHSRRLHSDYDPFVNSRAPKKRPVSFMIALDRFELLHSRDYTTSRKELTTRVVEPGDLVIFTNNFWHSGGENSLDHIVYRVFGYMVSDPADFPGPHVFFP